MRQLLFSALSFVYGDLVYLGTYYSPRSELHLAILAEVCGKVQQSILFGIWRNGLKCFFSSVSLFSPRHRTSAYRSKRLVTDILFHKDAASFAMLRPQGHEIARSHQRFNPRLSLVRFGSDTSSIICFVHIW